MVKLVMPGLVPGIHVLAAFKQERRGWPGRSPAMTEMNHFQAVRKSLRMLAAFSVRLSGNLYPAGSKNRAVEGRRSPANKNSRVFRPFRHGRACPGHLRLSCLDKARTWMPGTRPGMTNSIGTLYSIGCFFGQTLSMRSETLMVSRPELSPPSSPAPPPTSSSRSGASAPARAATGRPLSLSARTHRSRRGDRRS
jgi:hypothetical protein